MLRPAVMLEQFTNDFTLRSRLVSNLCL